MKNHFILACMALLMFACNPKEKEYPTFKSITAVPMPSTLASGQKFPTDSTTINNWVNNSIVINNLETNERTRRFSLPSDILVIFDASTFLSEVV